MLLTVRDGLFVADSSFREKDIPKGAGMRWNAPAKRWETLDWHVAAKLAGYCDDGAKAAVEHAQQAEAASIEASRATDADVDVPAPEGLRYFPFQRAGIAYASSRPNTLIADEMGLGKTIQALGLINADETIRSVLVICPASLRLNWRREAKRWLVRPNTVIMGTTKGIPASADAFLAGMPANHVVALVVNYDILRQWRETLRSVTWDLLVADECHYLKSHKAQRTAEVFGQRANEEKGKERIDPIPARRRAFLTGTPIVNRPIELWPLLKACGWPNWRDYVTRYCAGYEDKYGWKVGGHSHLEELQEKLRSTIMVRRLKRDVLTELPPKRRQVIELPANGAAAAVSAEAEAWQAHQERIAALQSAMELAKASDRDEDYRAAVEALREGMQVAFTEMSRLRHETALAKVPYVVDHLTEAVDSSGRVVCFAHHHDVIAAIRQGLKEAGIESVALTGEMTNMADRQESIDRFQGEHLVMRDGKPTMEPLPGDPPPVFVGSIQAAGLGITLTAASHVVFAELDWVPGNMSQAEDRCHRIGQTDSVLVQHLVLEGSLDAEIANRLVEKQAVIDKALDAQTEAGAMIDPDWASLIAVGEIATRNDSRAAIMEQAQAMTAAEISEVHFRLRFLAGMCDGALKRDGSGFNRYDTRIGHELAVQETLTPKQAALGHRLVQKYHGQLSGLEKTA